MKGSAYERQRAENARAWGPIDGLDDGPVTDQTFETKWWKDNKPPRYFNFVGRDVFVSGNEFPIQVLLSQEVADKFREMADKNFVPIQQVIAQALKYAKKAPAE